MRLKSETVQNPCVNKTLHGNTLVCKGKHIYTKAWKSNFDVILPGQGYLEFVVLKIMLPNVGMYLPCMMNLQAFRLDHLLQH